MTSDHHPVRVLFSLSLFVLIIVPPFYQTGYIVSNADDLLGLFNADFGILVIGEGAKMLGPNQHGQEILIIAEYLRLKQYEYVVQVPNLHGIYLNLFVGSTIQASQAVVQDYPDLHLSTGLSI